ncbi:Heme/hemopexin-binding protein precursor, partial [Haemophilus influenzae]
YVSLSQIIPLRLTHKMSLQPDHQVK